MPSTRSTGRRPRKDGPRWGGDKRETVNLHILIQRCGSVHPVSWICAAASPRQRRGQNTDGNSRQRLLYSSQTTSMARLREASVACWPLYLVRSVDNSWSRAARSSSWRRRLSTNSGNIRALRKPELTAARERLTNQEMQGPATVGSPGGGRPQAAKNNNTAAATRGRGVRKPSLASNSSIIRLGS